MPPSSSSSCTSPGFCTYIYTGSKWQLETDNCCRPDYAPSQPMVTPSSSGHRQEGRCIRRQRVNKPLRYFVAANFWLLFTLLMTIGQAPTAPRGTYRSFFGAGETPTLIYFAILAGVALTSISNYVLYARSGKEFADESFTLNYLSTRN